MRISSYFWRDELEVKNNTNWSKQFKVNKQHQSKTYQWSTTSVWHVHWLIFSACYKLGEYLVWLLQNNCICLSLLLAFWNFFWLAFFYQSFPPCSTLCLYPSLGPAVPLEDLQELGIRGRHQKEWIALENNLKGEVKTVDWRILVGLSPTRGNRA